ncbi:MAG: hypothetical protein DMG21_07715 [Acidobacteria bacterium]|nr:MAG: hypothetical protein DMG21_07715 [Acidobacteriota bacterium]
MILFLLCLLTAAIAVWLLHLSARAPERRHGWAALWRLASLIGLVRISALLIGQAAYRHPGPAQVPGYLLQMLGLPEIVFVRSARFEPRRWAVLASTVLALSSFVWAALLIWVANRIRPEGVNRPKN